jgi:hypothetical protein
MVPQFIADDVVIQLPANVGSLRGWAQENGRCLHGYAYNEATQNCEIAFGIRNSACWAAFLIDSRGDFFKAWGKLVVCNASSSAQRAQCTQQAVEKAPNCPTPCDQCGPSSCFTPEWNFGRVLNPSNCRCECPESCPPGQVQNPITCSCACPPCVWGQTQDPETCVCTCPNGEAACASLCCPTGWGCCGDPGFCTPLDSIANCGACGNSCRNGMDCENGACGCQTGTLCNGACVDTRRDRDNCGACNAQCLDTQLCDEGVCRCPSTSATLCNNACVQTSTDSSNCGECGAACLQGQSCTFDPNTGEAISCMNYPTACQNGKCVCTLGFYSCGPTWCAAINFPTCCYSTLGIEAACPAGTACMADSASPLGFRCQ